MESIAAHVQSFVPTFGLSTLVQSDTATYVSPPETFRFLRKKPDSELLQHKEACHVWNPIINRASELKNHHLLQQGIERFHLPIIWSAIILGTVLSSWHTASHMLGGLCWLDTCCLCGTLMSTDQAHLGGRGQEFTYFAQEGMLSASWPNDFDHDKDKSLGLFAIVTRLGGTFLYSCLQSNQFFLPRRCRRKPKTWKCREP